MVGYRSRQTSVYRVCQQSEGAGNGAFFTMSDALQRDTLFQFAGLLLAFAVAVGEIA